MGWFNDVIEWIVDITENSLNIEPNTGESAVGVGEARLEDKPQPASNVVYLLMIREQGKIIDYFPDMLSANSDVWRQE